jgi:hypothetical protein
MRLDLSSLRISAAGLMFCAAAFLAAEAVTWAMRRQFWIDWFLATPVLFRRALYSALMAAFLLLFQGKVTFIYARF